MIKKLYNVVVFVFIGFSIACAIYPNLPTEILTKIPELNQLTVLTMGGTSGVLGGTMLVVNDFIHRAKMDANDQFLLLSKSYLALKESHDALLEKSKAINDAQNESIKRVERLEKMIEVDLRAKLSNRYLSKEIKDEISGVLDEK